MPVRAEVSKSGPNGSFLGWQGSKRAVSGRAKCSYEYRCVGRKITWDMPDETNPMGVWGSRASGSRPMGLRREPPIFPLLRMGGKLVERSRQKGAEKTTLPSRGRPHTPAGFHRPYDRALTSAGFQWPNGGGRLARRRNSLLKRRRRIMLRPRYTCHKMLHVTADPPHDPLGSRPGAPLSWSHF